MSRGYNRRTVVRSGLAAIAGGVAVTGTVRAASFDYAIDVTGPADCSYTLYIPTSRSAETSVSVFSGADGEESITDLGSYIYCTGSPGADGYDSWSVQNGGDPDDLDTVTDECTIEVFS